MGSFLLAKILRGEGGGGAGGGVRALCFEWGFTRTFSGNHDVAVK